MIALFCLCVALFVSPFKSKSRLEAENAALRHQLVILRRKVRGRVRLTDGDRLFFIQLYRWFPTILKAITIVRPETLVRWHRAGFRRYGRWKSRSLGGRPQINGDLRALIRRMSVDNPLWGAPRIHGELLKLGFEVAQSSVAKYMVKQCGPPSPGWRAFLRNHAPDIAAMDLFVAPTIGFDLREALSDRGDDYFQELLADAGGGIILSMGRDRTQQATPICSRRRGRSESHLHRQSKSRLRRSGGMSCQRTCPTPSNISTIENWTCSLQRLSKRLSGASDRYPTFRQIYLINRYGSGRLERTDRPMGRTWKWRRSL